MLESIVTIKSENQSNDGFGTGFVIYNDGEGVYILTCKHVVDDVVSPIINELFAQIIVSSNTIDMTLLYVPRLNLIALPMQIDSCDSLEIDVIGYSLFNQDYRQKKHIYAKLFKEPIELFSIETHQSFNARKLKAKDNFRFSRGNSGSPVICKKSGKVIAMVSNKEGRDIAYAVEVSYLADIWREIPKNLLQKKSKKSKDDMTINRYIIAGIITLSIITALYLLSY